MTRVRLVVCADDHGLSAGVNDAIADLVERGRLSAVSCLVDAPEFAHGAARIAQLGSRADIGLHLNLTESFGERAPRHALPALIARAYGRRLDPAVLRSEIRRQLDRFEEACGFAPHHVDGHQHVHQLPIVRDALLAELESRPATRRPWLRSGVPPQMPAPLAERLKPAVLGALGARALVREAAKRGFATNRHLLGVYGFAGSADDYVARLERWLAQAGDCDLLMTHPGAGERPGDPIAAARRIESSVLGGPAFERALAARGIEVARLPR
jgi:chitin disaccharide deacetylase